MSDNNIPVLHIQLPGRDVEECAAEINGRLSWRSLIRETTALTGRVQDVIHFMHFQRYTPEDITIENTEKVRSAINHYGMQYDDAVKQYWAWNERFGATSPDHGRRLKESLVETYACLELCRFHWNHVYIDP